MSNLRERSFELSVVVIKMYKPVAALGPQFAHVALQLFRAASSAGAMLEEASAPSSRRDMAFRQGIALRESKEAKYWLRLLIKADVKHPDLLPSFREADELVAMLTRSVENLRRPPPPGPTDPGA